MAFFVVVCYNCIIFGNVQRGVVEKIMKTKCMTMVMIENKKTNKVLVQERVQSYKGLSFPGGHVDEGESFYDCAVREVKEETGLDVLNLKSCGTVHFAYTQELERYLIFLYKTSDYSGELIIEHEEGRHTWMRIDELKVAPTENNTPQILQLFLNDEYSELYCPYDGMTREYIYK